MPKPRKGEKKSKFISRCIEEVMKEGKDQKQAAGQCYGMWEHAKSKAKASVKIGKDEILIENDKENFDL